jgi:hypothetical protein
VLYLLKGWKLRAAHNNFVPTRGSGVAKRAASARFTDLKQHLFFNDAKKVILLQAIISVVWVEIVSQK